MRLTALINPIAGGGSARDAWAAVARQLPAEVEVTVVETRDRAHAIDAARVAAADARTVVAVGGDGLVRDAATGVVDHDGLLAVVPAGRGNDLLHRLGLPIEPDRIASALLAGDERRIDVLDVGGVLVPGNVYVGLDSLSTVIINRNRWLPAHLLYRLAPYVALARWRPAAFEVTADGAAPVTTRGHIAVIANSGRYGHGLHIVPSAEPDDGRIDVLVFGAVPRYRLRSFLRDAETGAHAGWPEAVLITGTSITLAADRPVPVCADGDELGDLPVRVGLRPSALRLVG